MKELTYRYENAKKDALKLMKAGKINAYFKDLVRNEKIQAINDRYRIELIDKVKPTIRHQYFGYLNTVFCLVVF